MVMSLITLAAFTEWVQLYNTLPMQARDVVNFLERQRKKLPDSSTGKNLIQFVYQPASDGDGEGIVVRMKKPQYGSARYTFSESLQNLLQLEDNSFLVAASAEIDAQSKFSPRPSMVVNYGFGNQFYLWAMNGGTLWVNPANRASVQDLSRYIVQMKLYSEIDQVSIRYRENVEDEWINMRLLTDDTISTWLATHRLMPTTVQQVVDYLTLILAMFDPPMSQLVTFSRSGQTLKLTMNVSGTYEVSTAFNRFVDDIGSRVLMGSANPELTWHYDNFTSTNTSGISLHSLKGNHEEVMLSVARNHTLECHHGLQHVLGFQTMTAGSKLFQLNEDLLPPYATLHEPLTLSTELQFASHPTLTTLTLPTDFYATKRELWNEVTKHLTLWPPLTNPAMTYRTANGYEVGFDFFRPDLVDTWVKEHDDFPVSDYFVATFLNEALTKLSYDPLQMQLNFGSRNIDDVSYFEVAVRGGLAVGEYVTLTFSPAMLQLLGRTEAQLVIRVIPGSVRYVRWRINDRRFEQHSPCSVIPLADGPDHFLFISWFGTVIFNPALRQILTFFPPHMKDDDSVYRVRALNLDEPLREPQS